MKSTLLNPTPLLIAGLLVSAMSANAAVITWGTATAVSTGTGNSSDVSTNGTVVEAYNAVPNDDIGTATNVTVNTVTFTPTTSLLNADPKNGGANDFSSGTNSGDATYDTLLSRLEYGGGNLLVTITIGEGDGNGTDNAGGLLTVGLDYEIQVWFVEDRPGGNNPTLDARIMTFGDGEGGGLGNHVDLNDEYSIGTFTADGTEQILTLVSGDSGTGEGAGGNFGQSHISAYQIRLVPEPSAALLSGLAGLALLARRRRS